MGIQDVANTIDLSARKVAFELSQASIHVPSEKFQLLIQYFQSSLERTFGVIIEKTDISSRSYSAGAKRTEKGKVDLFEESHRFTLSFVRKSECVYLQEFIAEITRVAEEYDGIFRDFVKSLTPGYSDYITIDFPHPNPMHDLVEP